MVYKIDEMRHIILGRTFDGGIDDLQIDCSAWFERYPQLVNYRIEVTNPNGIVYFADSEMSDDHILTWKITGRDTAVTGDGVFQIVATGNNGERKTSCHPKLTIASIMNGTAGEAPPEGTSWADNVLQIGQEVKDAVAHPPIIGENGNWMLWNMESEAYEDSGKPSVVEGGMDQITINGKAPDEDGNIEVREVPEGAGSYQQLVTGADGVAQWEANPLHKTDRLTLKLSPAFDKAGSNGKYIGCAATNDAAQRAIAVEIGGEILKKAEYSKSGYTFFWDGVKYVASFRALPFVWTKGSSIGMKDGTTPFPFDATCVSANGGANLNITYDDGQDHTFEWVLAEPKAKPLDEEWIPTTVPVIQTAEAGQVVTVKAVDENGKPTEWEATNTDNLKGDPGEPGRDGVSVTHSWDGTVLHITSASGTTSANLKGQPGEKGEPGENGVKGDTGDSGVCIDNKEPTDPNVKVWINPDGTADQVVLYAPQTLTEEQKAQARSNIGVVEGEYELIDRIVFGYELLTKQPADWATNYGDYYAWAETTLIQCPRSDIWYTNPVYKAVEFEPFRILTMNKEPDGTPYNFSKMIAIAYIPPATNMAANSSGSINYSWGNVCVLTLPHAHGANTYWAVIEARVENGFVMAKGGNTASKWANMQMFSPFSYRAMKPAKSLTEFKAQMVVSDVLFSRGTVYEIWGVRAK